MQEKNAWNWQLKQEYLIKRLGKHRCLEKKMKTSTILLNFILGLVLYLGNGTIGKLKTYPNHFWDYPSYGFDKIPRTNFAGHFFQKIVHPAIYLSIIVALLQYFHHAELAMQMWLIVPMFWLFRI